MNMQAFRPMSINRVQHPLTIDAVRSLAPSAFATSAHESRSSRYAYIPTSEVITALVKEGFQPFSATQSRCRIEGKSDYTKHLIRFRHVSTGIARQVGDVIPEVALMNSHDGSSSYWLMEAMYRLTCLNGMFVAETGGQTLKVMHTGDIVRQVIEGSYNVIDRSVKALGTVDTWSNLQLTAGEQHAFATAAHELRFADSEGAITTPITAAQLLSPRRREDQAPNHDWRTNLPAPDLSRTLNVVQENVIKGGLHGTTTRVNERGRAVPRRITTRQVNGIDQDVKLNRALWMLAEKMAELKGAQRVA